MAGKNEGKMRNALPSDVQTVVCHRDASRGPHRLHMQMKLLIILWPPNKQQSATKVTAVMPQPSIRGRPTSLLIFFCRDLESFVLFVSPKEKKHVKNQLWHILPGYIEIIRRWWHNRSIKMSFRKPAYNRFADMTWSTSAFHLFTATLRFLCIGSRYISPLSSLVNNVMFTSIKGFSGQICSHHVRQTGSKARNSTSPRDRSKKNSV